MTETPEITKVNGHGAIVSDTGPVPGQRAPVDEDEQGPELVRTPVDLVDEPEPEDLDAARADEAESEDADLGEPIDLLPLLPEALRAPHRFARRHAGHVATGTRIYAARRRDARSTARHERMMRAAEAAGDHASALEWETRAAAFRKERHTRRMALLRAPVHAEEGEDGSELVPDESAILAALRNLNLGTMNKAVREGWKPRWILGAVEDGAGWHAQLMLPQGVNVEMINGKKPLLASNLLRQPIEVWPSEPKNMPGVLDLWVAHPGTLTGKVAPWPLLKTGTCDYFKGVPVAVSLRGQQIIAPLFEKNFMIGGIMGTGKSSATRNLLLGAMLDPLVDIDVYVMAYNSDYDPMRRRLRTLVKGDEDEDVEQALKALRRLRTEVTVRGQILEEAGEMKVTRELARRNKRLRPLIC